MLPAHYIGRRLALQVLIVLILAEMPQLCCKRAAGLAMGFGHGPEPGQVNMRIPDGIEDRCRAPVVRFQHGTQDFPGCTVAADTAFQVLLKITDKRCPLECIRDLFCAQAVLIHLIAQLVQGFHVHQQLIGILVPDPVGQVTQVPAFLAGQFVLVIPGDHRPRHAIAAARFRIEMPGIGLDQDVIAHSRLAAFREPVVFDIVVRKLYPGRPVCAEGSAVDIQRALPAAVQVHDNPPAFGFLRKDHSAMHPAVFILMPPGCAFAHGFHGSDACFLHGQVIHGTERFHRDVPQRQVQVFPERGKPVPEPVSPFRCH